MDFYAEIETALFSADINTKELIVDRVIEYCKKENIEFLDFTPKIQEEPSYSKFATIVKPKDLPKRGDFSKKEALVALIHSITHIEFSAIDLALDAVYRFNNMPKEFKVDWLIVAQDEIRHFKMLSNLLEKLGVKYGDLPVHKGLFEVAYNSKDSAIERMAVVPRYFEASGLDVNPKIINKLKSYKKSDIIKELIEALGIIYNEEIEHVFKGDKWFKYLCKLEGSNPQSRYKDILQKYKLKSRANQFDINGRKKAGFSCEELLDLGAKQCS
jgi:uncharacterized ferritin-like protein (DUF455 family)